MFLGNVSVKFQSKVKAFSNLKMWSQIWNCRLFQGSLFIPASVYFNIPQCHVLGASFRCQKGLLSVVALGPVETCYSARAELGWNTVYTYWEFSSLNKGSKISHISNPSLLITLNLFDLFPNFIKMKWHWWLIPFLVDERNMCILISYITNAMATDVLATEGTRALSNYCDMTLTQEF